MKKFILFLILTILNNLNGNSQNYNLPIDSNGNVVFSEVINSDISKSKLYDNAQEWIAKTFRDYKKVIQFEDEKNGELILKGTSKVKYFIKSNLVGIDISNRGKIQFNLTIECRENKYRYTMDNIVIIFSTGGQNFENSIFDRINNIKASKNKIKILNQALENLKKINTSSFKKRKLKEHQSDISKIKLDIQSESSSIESNNKFINSEIQSINSIIHSLKNSMSKIDNF